MPRVLRRVHRPVRGFLRTRVMVTLSVPLLALTAGAALVGPPAGASPIVAAATGKIPPVAGVDHWHVAYGVYVCDKYLSPVESSGEDPLGVHTHGDGLIHVHPFKAGAAGTNAILKRFFESENLKVTAKTITVGSKKYETGGDCNGKKATVRTLVWSSLKATSSRVLDGDPSSYRFVNGELLAFVYAPADAKVPMPPSKAELDDPADLPPPPLNIVELGKLPAPPNPVPTLKLTGTPPTKLTITDVVKGTGAEAKKGTRAYVRYNVVLWRTGEILDTSGWKAGEQPTGLNRLGRGKLLPGLEKGLLGMKVGGVREIVMPPAEAFGTAGSGPVKGTDTIVFLAQLVAVT